MSENKPFLSIVIPTYNRAHLISKTLDSLLEMTNDDFEVIVVDDGSTDNTEEVVSKYLSNQIRYVKTVNSERAAARNTGTKLALGEYVNWLDSDDRMLPNHVDVVMEEAKRRNKPEVMTFDYQIRYLESNKVVSVKSEYKPNSQRDQLIDGNYLATNAVIVRKDVALTHLFNEDRDLSASEDYELWLRLRANYPFVYIPIVTTELVLHNERSVYVMTSGKALEIRFTTLIKYALADSQVMRFLAGSVGYFKMRNYLILAVNLMTSGNRLKGLKYLLKAALSDPRIVAQRSFYAAWKRLFIPVNFDKRAY